MLKFYTVRVLLFVAGAFWAFNVIAQKNLVSPELYNSSIISDSLKENANSVTRYFYKEIIVKSAGKVVYKEHLIRTILNEKDEDEAEYMLGYDKKFSEVNSVEMRVYDSKGVILKKYKKGDFYDRSAVDFGSLITDNRFMYLKHTVVSYPVTIEKIEETTNNSYLDLSDWHIQGTEESVEHAVCKVYYKPEVGFRYKVKNFRQEPRRSKEGEFEVCEWDVKNLKAIKTEEGSESWTYLPKVSLATNAINFDGHEGDMSTWNGFALWQKELNKDVAVLSPKRVEEIRKMVAGISSDREKAKFLYQYLQKNFRYVGIQLGIGGLKPFPASFVDEKKYGDCKALSNYMHTLLKCVGITSHYAIVRSGVNEEPADSRFVNDPFNHIILCVPSKTDTTWLECTSNTTPFGKLGTFTENRNALIITEDGGKLVNTPKSSIDDNVFDSEATIKIEANGVTKAHLKIKSTGEYRDMFIGIAYRKTDERKKYLIDYLNLRQPDIFELKDTKDENGIKEVDLELEYEKLSDMAAGGKSFYRPRLFDLWRATMPPLEKRKTDYFFEHPMRKRNTTTIKIPAGTEVDNLPANVSLKFSYGSYSVNYSYNKEQNEVKAVSQFELINHVIPADKYKEMQAFMDEVAKSMNKKMVLRKKV